MDSNRFQLYEHHFTPLPKYDWTNINIHLISNNLNGPRISAGKAELFDCIDITNDFGLTSCYVGGGG